MHVRIHMVRVVIIAAIASLATVAFLPAPPTPEAIAPPFIWNRETWVDGLASPDGLVIDARTGDRFVTEENRAAILRIDPAGHIHRFADASTPIYRDGDAVRAEGLQSPEGLAIDPHGHLYVVEDRPGGRVISFSIMPLPPDTQHAGTVIALPLRDHSYAWEGIDAAPDGALIIAGSDAEALMDSAHGVASMPRGVLLYRDKLGVWWMPLQVRGASFSAVQFYDDGKAAAFASEMPGEVGCINLQTRTQQTWIAPDHFASPEGLAVLPDHSMIVAEETGAIFRIDPLTGGRKQLIMQHHGGIESIVWDENKHALLFTDDAAGRIERIAAPVTLFAAREQPHGPSFDLRPVDLRIPRTCPDYLAGVLRRAGYDPDHPPPAVPFDVFAERLSLVAVDAVCQPSRADHDIADPLTRIQFAVFRPNLFPWPGVGLSGPVSAFAAVTASGYMQKTRLVEGRVLRMADDVEILQMMGNQRLAVPYPFGARLGADGLASIHFMGAVEMPDYHLVINLVQPEQSYLLVHDPATGRSSTYNIQLPAGRTIEHWVMALPVEHPGMWIRL